MPDPRRHSRAVLDERDHDHEVWVASHKVGGAIDRVSDPDGRRGGNEVEQRRIGGGGFFAHDRDVAKDTQTFRQNAFAFLVSDRDEVARTLLGDVTCSERTETRHNFCVANLANCSSDFFDQRWSGQHYAKYAPVIRTSRLNIYLPRARRSSPSS